MAAPSLPTHAAASTCLLTTTLGEEGEIRQEGSATRETLGDIRKVELSCAVRALRLNSNDVWGYRDSGMQGWEANDHPKAFINADTDVVVERLVLEMRRFRPQVVLSSDPTASTATRPHRHQQSHHRRLPPRR